MSLDFYPNFKTPFHKISRYRDSRLPRSFVYSKSFEEACTDVSQKSSFRANSGESMKAEYKWYFIIQLECSAETIPISLLFSCENWDFYAVKCTWDWKKRKHSKYEMNLISAVKWRHGLLIEPGGYEYEWKERVEFKPGYSDEANIHFNSSNG